MAWVYGMHAIVRLSLFFSPAISFCLKKNLNSTQKVIVSRTKYSRMRSTNYYVM